MVPPEEPDEKAQSEKASPAKHDPLKEDASGSSFDMAPGGGDSSAATEQPLETEPPEIPGELHSFYEELSLIHI